MRPALPKQLVSNPLLSGKVFYCLPEPLLSMIERQPKLLNCIDAVTFALDRELAAYTKNLTLAIGFDDGKPILANLLPDFPVTDIPALGDWSEAETNAKYRAALSVLEARKHEARAYLGWLLTNPEFLQEDQRLSSKWEHYLRRYGYPEPLVLDNYEGFKKVFGATSRGHQNVPDFVNEFCQFYSRWQLEGMAGPLLPRPLQVHEVAFPNGLSINRYRQLTSTSSLPTISPTDNVETLRDKIERSSGRRRGPKHLNGWLLIAENANKNRWRQLNMFATLFRIAHFWRVFRNRYGRVTGAGGTFADYFGLPFETFRTYLRKIPMQSNTEF